MLIDDLARGRYLIPATVTDANADIIDGFTKDAVPHAEVILAENVWNYVGNRGGITIKDIPCVAPPFPWMAIESPGLGKVRRWCVLLRGLEMSSDEIADLRRDQPVLLSGSTKKPRWLLTGLLISSIPGETKPGIMGRLICVASDDGTPIHYGGHDFIDAMDSSEMNDASRMWFARCASVTLLTISFMHCKNVVQRVVAPPPKLSKRHKERHGRPLFSYRVLEIEPMKQVLRTEGRSEEVGLAKALHICRGHFKDYRERGLFGRNKGLYWWDQHARGSIEAGVVGKDYSVKAPT
jgi:hypothetical protein